MFAVAVTFRIKPDRLDDFLPLMLENARASLADEPGCHQFDVCQSPGDPAEIFLYELYDDAAAFETHKTMPHFQRFDQAIADMVAEKTVRTYHRLGDA